MKKTALFLQLLLIAGSAFALDIYNWDNDLEIAQEVAADESKYLFVYFAGSDWCGWCDRFHREILTTARFDDYLKENFVPVLIDFPRQIEQSEEMRAQNEALAARLDIRGFPTVVIMDDQGTEISRLGYLPGGPNNYISELRSILHSSNR